MMPDLADFGAYKVNDQSQPYSRSTMMLLSTNIWMWSSTS